MVAGEIPHYELKDMEANDDRDLGWAEARTNGGGSATFPREEAVTVAVAGNPRKPPESERDIVAAGSANGTEVRMMADGGRRQLKYFDYNFHAMKKGVSSALLDVALLMANASQLKSVYLAGPDQPFYEAMMTLLIISIVIQVVVGCILIWLSRININDADDKNHKQAEVLNNIVIISIFILTVVNVFTASIGISTNVKGETASTNNN